MTSLMRHSIITALGVCLVASFTACGNKQTKDAETVDSTAIKDLHEHKEVGISANRRRSHVQTLLNDFFPTHFLLFVV